MVLRPSLRLMILAHVNSWRSCRRRNTICTLQWPCWHNNNSRLDVYQLKQKSLVRYLPNVISYLHIGSMISTRVPFVEDAVKESALVSEAERVSYGKSNERSISSLSSTSTDNYQSIREIKKATTTDHNTDNADQKFAGASILLAIKGGHTTSPFLSGIYTKKFRRYNGQLSVGGRDRNYVDATRIGLSAGCRGSSSIREWHFEEIVWCHTSFIISRELHLLQNLECVLNAPNGRILVTFHSYRFVSWLSDIGVVHD